MASDPRALDQVSQVLGEVFGSRRPKSRGEGRERLSRDRIVEVAIEQMRENGYDAVTMRSIARELGTGPASLYAHVANRAELDQLVTDRVCAQWQIPDPDPARWDVQLKDALIDLLRIYRENPGVARCTLGMVPVEPGVLMVSERLMRLLKAGDVPDQYAAWFLDVGSLYVGSVAVEEDIWRERHGTQDADQAHAVEHLDEDEVFDQVRQVFESLPAEHFPMLSSMAGALTSGDGDDRFGFGVDLLIAGLRAMSARGH